jgi:predicted nucleic acid-binding protein
VLDTSVWVDHFRKSQPEVVHLLQSGQIMQHAMVTGELAMGNLHNWAQTVQSLRCLPAIATLEDEALFDFVHSVGLPGTGLGLVDAHILGAVAAMPECRLWTYDQRLKTQAERLGGTYQSES